MKEFKTIKVLAVASVLATVVGCGGNGSNPTSVQAVAVSGGIATLRKTDTPAVAANTTGTPTEYTTSINGVTKTVVIPASGEAFPAGTPIAVFPDNVPILSGELAARAPGDVLIIRFSDANAPKTETKFSSIVSSTNGSIVLTKPLGLLPGSYQGIVEGPVDINGEGGKRLTVGTFKFQFEVNAQGVCSFPTTISGVLPVNGGHTGSGNISMSMAGGSELVGGDGGLSIQITENQEVQESSKYNSESRVTFKSNKGGFRVPKAGVEVVSVASLFKVNL